MISLTNLNAMRSAAAMADSNADIKTSMERLSTGSRINSASDDAAGLAISERMNTQVLGTATALTNATDGTNLLSTADGALAEVSNLLQRMRELSIQAATGSATDEDRLSMSKEYEALKSEIDRIGAQTQWNGTNLFDGSVFTGATKFQVGPNANQTIEVTIDKLSTVTISNGSLATPTNWTQLGSDIDGEHANDMSGGQVSISGDGSVVAIGANLNDGNGNNSGHTRIYQFNTGSGGWEQLGDDIDGEAADDQSGSALSLSGDGTTVAIGANDNDGNGSGSGHTRILRYDSGSDRWLQVGADIDGEAAGDFSGNAVSLSNDGATVAIGALLNAGNGNRSGHTRIYRLDDASGNWVQLGADIDGEAAGDLSGGSVALSGDGSTVVIGAYSNSGNGNESGHARAYRYNATSASWVQLGADIDGEAAGDESGTSVSISDNGSVIAIGGHKNDGNGADSGHTRVYQYNTASTSWVQLGDDIDGEGAGDRSGTSVSLSSDGNKIAIGAMFNAGGGHKNGHTRLYEYDATAAGWVQVGDDIDGEATSDNSGRSVSLSSDGTTVAIGANSADQSANDTRGHVRIYQTAHSLYGTKLTSQSNADYAMVSVDTALQNINFMRAKYGTVINQLGHAVNNLSDILVNAESSLSKVHDADYAKESANLTSAQIRNQGAKAMLAQANTDQELTFKLIEDWL